MSDFDRDGESGKAQRYIETAGTKAMFACRGYTAPVLVTYFADDFAADRRFDIKLL